MISFVCFLWRDPRYRTQFTAAHVNTLARMIGRHYDAPHRVLCVTNDPAGIDPGIEIVPDRQDFAEIPPPHGAGNPSCYRRLRLFAPNAAAIFGERIVSIDLDCVVTGDLRPLFDRPEEFVGWSDPLRPAQYCGSLTELTAGSRPQVWEQFDPARSPGEAVRAKCYGSDQGWVSYCLGPGEAQWTRADGVYSHRWDLKGGALPANARIVFFTGEVKPWDSRLSGLSWVRDNYC